MAYKQRKTQRKPRPTVFELPQKDPPPWESQKDDFKVGEVVELTSQVPLEKGAGFLVPQTGTIMQKAGDDHYHIQLKGGTFGIHKKLLRRVSLRDKFKFGLKDLVIIKHNPSDIMGVVEKRTIDLVTNEISYEVYLGPNRGAVNVKENEIYEKLK